MERSTSHRSLWLALALGLVAGGSIAVYRMRRQQEPRRLAATGYDRWRSDEPLEDMTGADEFASPGMRPVEGRRPPSISDTTPTL